MDNPVVSIIIPAFNCEAYIGEALDSIRNQTFRDFEILVVDDGSNDETLAISRRYSELDPRIRVFRRDEPSGRPACARNIALSAAAGEYIAFLDADDIALPHRLESSLKALRRAQATLAFADFRKFRGRQSNVTPEAYLSSQNFIRRASNHLEQLFGNVFLCGADFAGFMLSDLVTINTQTVVFARSLLAGQATWFDESLVGGEDIDLFHRLAITARVVFINEVQTLQRLRADSLTATQAERCVLDAVSARKANLARLRPVMSARAATDARRAIARELCDLGYNRWRGARLKEAREAYRQSWRLSPSCAAAIGYFKALAQRSTLVSVYAKANAAGHRDVK